MRLLKNVLVLCTILVGALIIGCAAKEMPVSNVETNAGTEDIGEESDSPTEAANITDSGDITDGADESTENEEEEKEEDNIKKDGFVFVYNGINIYLGENTERVLGELGKEGDYNESPSCTYEGTLKIYSYNSFAISTYMKHKTDCDRVYSVRFNDDSVTTTEGVYIGQTYDDMVAVYGTEYTEITGLYRYVKEGTVLAFGIDENGSIYSIEYQIEDIYG